MLKVRLEGLPEEVQKGVVELEKVYKVLAVSREYRNRGTSDFVRKYIDVELKGEIKDE